MSEPTGGESLSQFLRTHSEEILRAWDEFAGTLAHGGGPLGQKALRDHAAEILSTIAADIEQPQSDAERRRKSRGEEPAEDGGDTAAETHADTRITAGFAIGPMVTEYRALRASVLNLWAQSGRTLQADDVLQITRFNEAIDQALVESVSRYTGQTKRATDLFIGVLGHDIRNPLGTIAMAVHNLVRSGRLDAEAARPILNSARRINAVIEQVVDFTRAHAGSPMPVTRHPGDLAAHVREVVEETQIRRPDALVELQQGPGSYEGSWDKGRIGQLLSNLLGNAILYGDCSQPIVVQLRDLGPEIELEVRNRGPVIPPADCRRIFEPLMRGISGQAAPESGGLGLGLYICQQIVLAHGGTISAASDEAAGTRMRATLPRHPAATP